jgi:hypothetical protein
MTSALEKRMAEIHSGSRSGRPAERVAATAAATAARATSGPAVAARRSVALRWSVASRGAFSTPTT